MGGNKWTGDEIDRLRRGGPVEGRTERACREKRKRLGLVQSRYANQPSYTKHELAERLGVTPYKPVYWRGKGWLHGSRDSASGQWTYARAAVRRFLLRHAEVIDSAKVDMAWLVDVLTSGPDTSRTA